MGVILNRPTRRSLGSLFPEHEPSKKVMEPVYYGGPFSRGALVALVQGRPRARAPASVLLMKNLYLAFRANTIDQVIESTPNEARYYVGYVGWRPGELRSEIDRGLWSVHQRRRRHRSSARTPKACGRSCCSRPGASAPPRRRKRGQDPFSLPAVVFRKRVLTPFLVGRRARGDFAFSNIILPPR